MKKQEGITLVALVITIIVLLILAGVSISLVIGNNGVLTQASNAVITNNTAAAKQDIEMAVASCYTDYMAAWASDSSVAYTDYMNATKITSYLPGDSSVTGTNASYTYSSGNTSGISAITFSVDTNGAVSFN